MRINWKWKPIVTVWEAHAGSIRLSAWPREASFDGEASKWTWLFEILEAHPVGSSYIKTVCSGNGKADTLEEAQRQAELSVESWMRSLQTGEER